MSDALLYALYSIAFLISLMIAGHGYAEGRPFKVLLYVWCALVIAFWGLL